MYFVVLIKALVEQSIPEGWAYITSDDWSYVSFVDNMLGIMFTLVLIALRERNNGLVELVAWLSGVTFLGNGVTCLYVCWCCRGNLIVKEVYLCRDLKVKGVRLDVMGEDSESD